MIDSAPKRALLLLWRGLLAVVAGAIVAPAAGQIGPLPGADAFSRPDGPYPVGVREVFWANTNRPEPYTKDSTDLRRLIMRVWYPAEGRSDAQSRSWTDRALYIESLNEFGGPEDQRALPYSLLRPYSMRVRTHSVAEAAVSALAPRFPVLVYHPGGGQPRFAATFLTEQLASHGYVVVGVDHPGLSPTIRFPDGSLFESDTLNAPPPPTGDQSHDALAAEHYLDRDVFPVWTADAVAVLDWLEQMNRTPGQPFFERLDLTRVGMLGWSFGGATSLQMSKDDPRVRAAVNFDGQLFGDVRETGTHRPALLMDNGAGDRFDTFLERSTGDWYAITIGTASHASFSDLPLFSTPNPQESVYRIHEIAAAYTVAFFSKYLLGVDSEFLSGPSDDYPEVMFRKRH